MAHRAGGSLLRSSRSWCHANQQRPQLPLRAAACPWAAAAAAAARPGWAAPPRRRVHTTRSLAATTEPAASPELESVKVVVHDELEEAGDGASAASRAAPGAAPSGRKKWAQVDRELLRKEHTVPEAIALIKALAASNFDEGVDCVMKLGLDPRRAEQQIRGMATLPYNTGRAVRICVFAEPELQEGLAEAGAEWVGGTDLMDSILEGDVPIEFNRCLASPSIMPVLGEKLGRMLGPKKLMPNVRVGTVTSDLPAGIDAALKGQASFRLDKGANIHANIGRVSMDEELLVENALALIQAVVDAQPAKQRTKGGKTGGKAKGTSMRYVEKVALSSTMGKSLKIRRMSLNLRKSIADDE
jgi:large subunit ribosomal protein L1